MNQQKSTFQAFKEKANDMFISKQAAAVAFLVTLPGYNAFATDVTNITKSDSMTINNWPWTKFLNALAEELTGPLAMVLGILAICVAAFGMFMGNHGAGMQKMLTLIFAVGILLFAPNFINYMKDSASGLTILAGM